MMAKMEEKVREAKKEGRARPPESLCISPFAVFPASVHDRFAVFPESAPVS